MENQKEKQDNFDEIVDKSLPQKIRELFSETWSPELVISPFAIFALYQLPNLIYDTGRMISDNYHLHILGYGPMLYFFMISIYVLIVNFGIHLILRSFWVGIIGLQSVFLKGINYEKLSYGQSFIDFIKGKPNLSDFSKKFDDICSSIFAFAFLIMLNLLSIGIFFFFFCLLNYSANFTGTNLPSWIFLGLGLIYFIDFITFGILKKNNLIFKMYRPIYLMFNLISLSYFYRPIYYTFLTNLKTWKFKTIYLSYIGLFVVLFILFFNERNFSGTSRHEVSVKNYENLRPETVKVPYVSINADIINGSFLKLFINKIGIGGCQLYNKQHDRDVDSIIIACMKSIHQIKINDSIYSDLNFKYFEYPDNKGKGVVAYISTKSLKIGENILIVKNVQNGDVYPIPFWFDINK